MRFAMAGLLVLVVPGAGQASQNGSINWSILGSGTRIPGGWVLDGAAVPATATIRARGFVPGAGISGWFLEEYLFQQTLAILTGDDNFGVRADRFGFNMTGSPGQTAILEGSTNLAAWTALLTNQFGGTPLYFADPVWTNFPAQFYRLRSL